MNPSSCPICGNDGGFHDSALPLEQEPHYQHEVPRHLVRPSNSALRRMAKEARAREVR